MQNNSFQDKSRMRLHTLEYSLTSVISVKTLKLNTIQRRRFEVVQENKQQKVLKHGLSCLPLKVSESLYFLLGNGGRKANIGFLKPWKA